MTGPATPGVGRSHMPEYDFVTACGECGASGTIRKHPNGDRYCLECDTYNVGVVALQSLIREGMDDDDDVGP